MQRNVRSACAGHSAPNLAADGAAGVNDLEIQFRGSDADDVANVDRNHEGAREARNAGDDIVCRIEYEPDWEVRHGIAQGRVRGLNCVTEWLAKKSERIQRRCRGAGCVSA